MLEVITSIEPMQEKMYWVPMKSFNDQVTKKVWTNKHKSKVLQLLLPNSPKELKYFFGKINLVQKIINGFVKIVHIINDLLKKGVKIKWRPKVKRFFECMKVAISIALVLASPDNQLPFKVYYFSLENSFIGILTQKKDGEYERLIRFMNLPLKNVGLNYPNNHSHLWKWSRSSTITYFEEKHMPLCLALWLSH